MNINILKEKNEVLLSEVTKWVAFADQTKLSHCPLCDLFLQSCCDVHVSYKMACRAGNKDEFSDGLNQVVSAAIRLEYWIYCLEAYKPTASTEYYAIKKSVDEIKALCIASIKTMEKKKNPTESY